MEKTSTPIRWWDWISVLLLFFLLQTVASRLVATTWTPYLYLAQTASYIAYVVGIALGYSIFSSRLSRWLSIGYMVMMLPLQWTLMIDQHVSLEEQLISTAGRLYQSTSDFIAGNPVEDPMFFVVIMTLTFWVISAAAGFILVRRQNYLAAVIPSAIGILIIQNYDRLSTGRFWFIAFFAFMALLLLGRLHFLQNRQVWRERRVFLSPDNSLELSSSMAIAAGLLILISWTVPASLAGWKEAIQRWEKVTEPWRDFSNSMENAVDALNSPSRKAGDFFSSELPLGRGFSLSETVVFQVRAPDLPVGQKPPRYYWRGRAYDTFMNGQWVTTGAQRENYAPTPIDPNAVAIQERPLARFMFNTSDAALSLLYAPAQPVWVSRPGITFSQPSEAGKDTIAWYAYPSLQSGEVYQVDALLTNPNLQQLREAGTQYPASITEKYLQLPPDFSPRIQQLAEEITANAETPYDKASAVTQYLRKEIQYSASIQEPPQNRDTLEWVLFDYKQGYCVYYATLDVLMLRSLGIPARMAAGFSQGTEAAINDMGVSERESIDPNSYVVMKKNAHAWPEVYFPGIGWVEFEPTGNQPTLDRPLPPRDSENPDLAGPVIDPRTEDGQIDLRGQNQDEEGLTDTTQMEVPISPLVYVIPSLIAAAVLSFFLNRRYRFADRIPALVRGSLERTGLAVPKWIYNWENWGYLSPVEKAFESINFGLRLLGQSVPVHTTPAERANRLTGLLPQMSAQIKILLDEHQTSLYTSRVADVIQARRASLSIRKQVIAERLRYLFYGKPTA